MRGRPKNGLLRRQEYVPATPRRQRLPPSSFVGRVKTSHYLRAEMRRRVPIVQAGWGVAVKVVRVRGGCRKS